MQRQGWTVVGVPTGWTVFTNTVHPLGPFQPSNGNCADEIALPAAARISVRVPWRPRQAGAAARQRRHGRVPRPGVLRDHSVPRRPEEPDCEPQRWRSQLGKRQPRSPPHFIMTTGAASESYEVTGHRTVPSCTAPLISSCDLVANAWSWRIRRRLEADAKATSPHKLNIRLKL